jgi:hypothetical protein
MMTEYSQDLFFKEIKCPRIDNECLLKSEIPDFSQEEIIAYQETINPGRRDLVMTPDGIIKTAWHKGKTINDTKFNQHIIDLLKDEIDGLDDIEIKKQWVWGSSSLTCHTDWGRDSFYMYILEPGGDNVETRWFLEKNQPLIRKWSRSLTMINDTRDLIKVHSTVLKTNTWYHFNANIIHDIVGMTSMRTAIIVTAGVWKQ